jgi:HipA-like C-terminal domain
MDDLDLSLDPLRRALLARGVADSEQLQAALQRSQPGVSRLITAAGDRVLTIGRGRSTRYAWPLPIHTAAPRQLLHWVDDNGRVERLGELAFIGGNRVHVRVSGGDGFETLTQGRLPWFLTPLRSEGFLGRALARRLAPLGLADTPEAWPLEHQLFAALQTPDPPGAITLGDAAFPELPSLDDIDALCTATAQAGPFGSSAGGEQAKFLARDVDRHPVLVKFTPPRGSPFGERWHDLLHAEHIALTLLAEHGVPVAASRIVHTQQRTALVSRRFDRVGTHGRRHVVPLWAAHESFVAGPREHWGHTCEALERQRRLPPGSAAQARALLQFGRLIGNTDMHFGNLSLCVRREDLAAARFTLAPLYDMLPMRWRPDAQTGQLWDTPFTPDAAETTSAAAPLAAEFWGRVEASRDIGATVRALARTMRPRVKAA